MSTYRVFTYPEVRAKTGVWSNACTEAAISRCPPPSPDLSFVAKTTGGPIASCASTRNSSLWRNLGINASTPMTSRTRKNRAAPTYGVRLERWGSAWGVCVIFVSHGTCCVLFRNLFHLHCIGIVLAQAAVNDRHDQQCGDGSDHQSTNHGTAQRSVLLAALAQAERHGQHADDHRQRSHQHWTKPRRTRRGRRINRIHPDRALVVGKRDHQDGVSRRHADRHNRTHQRRDAERGSTQE